MDSTTSYNQLIENLLSADNQLRSLSEQQLEELKNKDSSYPRVLAYIATETDGSKSPKAVRQLASMLLKKYADQYWSSSSLKQPIDPSLKKTIIEIMLPSLNETDSKIHEANAMVLACIAQTEWIDGDNSMFLNVLNQLDQAENDSVLVGSLIILNQIIQSLGEDQLLVCLPKTLPKLINIISSKATSARCKINSINCLSICITTVSYYDNNELKINAIPKDFLSNVSELLLGLLQDNSWSDETCGIKRQAMVLLTSTLLYKSPNESNNTNRVIEIIKVVWVLLQEAKEPYVKGFIKDEGADTTNTCSVYQFVLSLLQFIEEVFDCGRYNKIVNHSMKVMLGLLVFYVQLSDVEVERYLSEPDQLIEEDHNFASVRAQCLHMLEDSCDALQLTKSFTTTIFTVLQEQIQQAADMKRNGDANWWKLQEACYFVITFKQDILVDCINKTVSKEDILSLLSNFVIPHMNCEIPLLAARSALVSSCFCSILPPKDLSELIDVLLVNFSTEGNEILRIFSIRSVFTIYERWLTDKDVNEEIIGQHLPAVFQACLECAASVEGGLVETIFEVIAIILTIEPSVADKHQDVLMKVMLDVFIKHKMYIFLKIHYEQIFTSIVQRNFCTEAIKQIWLPYLVTMLEGEMIEVESSLDILCSIVRHAKEPFNQHLVNSCFLPLLNCLKTSQDAQLYLNICSCLRAFIRSSSGHLLNFHDQSGTSVVEIIYTIVTTLLSTGSSQSIAAYAGRLISSFLLTFSKLLSQQHLDKILQETLLVMSSSKTSTVIEGLLGVYIHLFFQDTPATINYLTDLQMSLNGKTPLAYILNELCSRHGNLYTKYDIKASLVAMAKLLEFGLSTNNQLLANITVQGDEVHVDGPRTRSAVAQQPRVYSVVPLFVQIYKVLLKEVALLDRSAVDEDLVDSEFESEDEDGGFGALQYLNDSLGDRISDEDEEDVVNEELHQIDLSSFLCDAISTISSLSIHNSYFLPHLKESEKMTLRKLMTSSAQ